MTPRATGPLAPRPGPPISAGFRARRRLGGLLACAALLGACGRGGPAAPETLPAEPCPAGPPPFGGPVADPPLLVLVEDPGLDGEQARLLSAVRAEAATVEVHLGRLVESAETLLMEAPSLDVPVSPRRSFTVERREVERRGPADLSWRGSIVGDLGSVTLVLDGDLLTGTVQSVTVTGRSSSYRIVPLGGGLEALVCVDLSRLPPD